MSVAGKTDGDEVSFCTMNKAFISESEGGEATSHPSGKNYLSPQGYARLRQELLGLMDDERPKVVEAVSWAAKNGDRSENGDYLYGKKRLREIDRRIRFLTKRLEIAEVVDSSIHFGSDQIFFGATVTYAREDGAETTITILGIDEVDPLQHQVSWISPIARALLGARVGDELRLQVPGGWQWVEVLNVTYPQSNHG